jgi:hypothetical protein
MAKLQNFMRGPRYLRAIPSLVVLTTAMAWGVASDPDAMDAKGKKAGVTLSQRADSATGNAGAGSDPYALGLLPRR